PLLDLSHSSSFLLHHAATTVIYTLSLHDALPISLHFQNAGLRDLASTDELRRKACDLRDFFLALLKQREEARRELCRGLWHDLRDRKSTRLNSSHVKISYAVFCLKKKKKIMYSEQ